MKNIVSRFKRTSQRVIPACCCMILVLLLIACGGGTTSTPTPAPTPQPSPTLSPTPTPGLTVYTGKGYAISYPQGWKVTSSKDGVTFSGASDVHTWSSRSILIQMALTMPVTSANGTIDAGKKHNGKPSNGNAAFNDDRGR